MSGIKCHTYCEISLIKKWFGVVSGCTHGGEMEREMHPSQMALYTGQPLKQKENSSVDPSFVGSSVGKNLTREGGFPVISNNYR